MMRAVADQEDGTVLVFDCGGDLQTAHFGEMSCQLAYAHGCRGILLSGNCRDTQYVLKMDDFPVFSIGTRPHAFGRLADHGGQRAHLHPGAYDALLTVPPGDFVFDDSDGVQIIPEAIVDEVLLRVEEKFDKENREREQIAAGMPIDEVYKEFGVL